MQAASAGSRLYVPIRRSALAGKQAPTSLDDIAAVADQQAAVYVRWGYQTLSSPTAYSGWNLDDIEILGDAVGAALSLTFADSVNENAGPLTAMLSISAAQGAPLDLLIHDLSPKARYLLGSPGAGCQDQATLG